MEETKTKMHPAIRARSERISMLLSEIKRAKKIKIKSLIANFSMETGLSFRKIKEYLETLEAAKKIKIYTDNDFNSKDYGEVFVEYVGE